MCACVPCTAGLLLQLLGRQKVKKPFDPLLPSCLVRVSFLVKESSPASDPRQMMFVYSTQQKRGNTTTQHQNNKFSLAQREKDIKNNHLKSIRSNALLRLAS
jgi:hypothetical protein